MTLSTSGHRRLQPGKYPLMSEIACIRPGGDPAADDLAMWAGHLGDRLRIAGHPTDVDISFASPADRPRCELALSARVPLLLFFGHGDVTALLGSMREPVIDESNLARAAGKTLVSIACEAGREVGPAAIQAGVRAHLGWNVLLLWLGSDAAAYGEAIVEPLASLGVGASISEVGDALREGLTPWPDAIASGRRTTRTPSLPTMQQRPRQARLR